jgi:hypothetical protein
VLGKDSNFSTQVTIRTAREANQRITWLIWVKSKGMARLRFQQPHRMVGQRMWLGGWGKGDHDLVGLECKSRLESFCGAYDARVGLAQSNGGIENLRLLSLLGPPKNHVPLSPT